jgi:aspartate-semialdehyde dehydrogenase
MITPRDASAKQSAQRIGWSQRDGAAAPNGPSRKAKGPPQKTNDPSQQKEGKIGVAILAAPGAVGQRFVALLQGHPWFEVRCLVGDSSVGKAYGEAVNWLPDTPLPPAMADMKVEALADLHGRRDVQVVFSALPGGIAAPIESDLAARGFKVFTNARDHRMTRDVPLLVPEINADHLALVRRQKGPGWIVANGNCTSIVFQFPLAAIHRSIGVEEAHVVSLQGLSGAGYPGVSALDVVDNVVPFIEGEEEKLEEEPAKTLGKLTAEGIVPARIPVHATCTRVPVREGHTEAIHFRLARKATLGEVRSALADFRGPPDVAQLPTAPKRPIHVLEAKDRPQPRRDRDLEGGMATSVGRLRLSADGRGLRLVALGSNTIRGAAGMSILNAELAVARGFLNEQTKPASRR